MFASLLLVLAAVPDSTTAVIDLRGHTGEQVQRTLEQALPSLVTCLSPEPQHGDRVHHPGAGARHLRPDQLPLPLDPEALNFALRAAPLPPRVDERVFRQLLGHVAHPHLGQADARV